MDIVKNLNYSVNEINDILASVSTKASNADLTALNTSVTNLIAEFTAHAAAKTTLAEYGIEDAKIENGVITIGEQSVTPITAQDLAETEARLMALITIIQNKLDVNDAPSNALTGSDGKIFILKDGNYFVTKNN